MDTSLDTCFINDNCYNHRNECNLNYPNRYRETLTKLITIVTIEDSDLFNHITKIFCKNKTRHCYVKDGLIADTE